MVKMMENLCSGVLMVLALIGVSWNVVMVTSQQFPAMYVFGDSLTDNGNNNYLNSFAKANYVPYGVDFYEGPSGRFCNGRTIVDYLGDLLELPYPPAFANPFATGKNILRGVNYASAAAGILDETGKNLGERFSLSQQVENFETSLNQLKRQMSEQELRQHLAKSLVVIILGSNDYINNYLIPSLYPTSYIYNSKDYANLLIEHYTSQISALHSLGLRKFFLGGVGPLGCIPNQLATGLSPPGKCVSFVNDMLAMFNLRLRSLVDQLNTQHPDAIFVYGNTYRAFSDILDNATTYGFNVTDRGCCGIGRNQGQITCLPFSVPCLNRNQYIFWDAFHPTQAANQILARKAYTGSPSDCYPLNVKQMAQL
ncbi:hypothetical protein F0562_012997 [Nyssa sinensis]|uniref:SGNH hydrolase-type esterase domain-containing protein n=1 Tax=Nyssa sinensis TaxID=561372 RepID=A0A5J4ZZ00_9ASTE|nr:hypothetical protein F0562_012997 [Nyssa sinensis]